MPPTLFCRKWEDGQGLVSLQALARRVYPSGIELFSDEHGGRPMPGAFGLGPRSPGWVDCRCLQALPALTAGWLTRIPRQMGEEPLSPREAEVKARSVPRHVAVIMDGNGRWAEAQGLPRLRGHEEGAKSVRAVTRTARRIGCEALTLYAFSAQNWDRPIEEVNGLMGLLRDYLLQERDELLDTDIRLQAAGEVGRLPATVRKPLRDVCQDTAGCRSMVLTLCLSYGGREEILHMARSLARDVRDGTLDPSKIDQGELACRLWTGSLPDPDVVIRTSGEQRISNFLLWGCAYSELVFVPTFWPDFREEAFLDAVSEFQRRERRFGRTVPAKAGRGGGG